jgi:hypothetical protein
LTNSNTYLTHIKTTNLLLLNKEMSGINKENGTKINIK